MKVLNASKHAELILPDRRIHFTDAVEIKENGYVIKLKRVERPRIETNSVEISIEEDRVKVGKYEFILGNNDHTSFTIKGIKVDVYKL
jgi:hypothetical protein